MPLQPRPNLRIAVIGPTAADPLGQLNGYSFPVQVIEQGGQEFADRIETPLAGLQKLYGEDKVTYATGCFILEQRAPLPPVFLGDEDYAGKKAVSPVSMRTDMIEDATIVAAKADVAIVCVGDLAGLFQTGTVGEDPTPIHLLCQAYNSNCLKVSLRRTLQQSWCCRVDAPITWGS